MSRLLLVLPALLVLSACAAKAPQPPSPPDQPKVSAETLAIYGPLRDNGHDIPAVPPKYLSDAKARREVDYASDEKPGTIIVDPHARYLYRVLGEGRAMRYTVAVGAAGYGFTGEAHIPYQRDWPSWKPTPNMIATQPETYATLEEGLDGGLHNPLGARALYLHNAQGDTFYRIHGTMEPASIGEATSAGCIRLFNQDIIDLARQTASMTKVIVLDETRSGQGAVPLAPANPIATGA